MSSEMNFDEFRNFQERERLKKKEIDDNEAAEKKARQLKARKAKAAKDGITGEETPQKSKAGSIGEFLRAAPNADICRGPASPGHLLSTGPNAVILADLAI